MYWSQPEEQKELLNSQDHFEWTVRHLVAESGSNSTHCPLNVTKNSK